MMQMYPGRVSSQHTASLSTAPPSSMVVGAVGSFLANITPPLLEWARVDDAVGILSCHVYCHVMSDVRVVR